MQRILTIAGLIALSACSANPPLETKTPPPPPELLQILEKPPEVALNILPAPRFDRTEGPSRHLQFAGACILDIYYYAKAGQPMLGRYSEARLPNGQAIDTVQCLNSLRSARRR